MPTPEDLTPELDATDWPYTIDDPVRAVHFALEPDCPYHQPTNCPMEHRVAEALTVYDKWLLRRTGYAAIEEVAGGGSERVPR